MKIFAHCAVWALAFCAVPVSPVILIFGVPLAIGLGTDIVQSGAGPLAAVFIAASITCVGLCNASVRASVKSLLRSAAPLGPAKSLAAAAASGHAAKSIS